MGRMRLAVAAAALVASLAIGGVAHGATATLTIDGQVGGKEKPKFDRKKFKPTTIDIDTTTADSANPAAIPPKVVQTVVEFDSKDVKFDHKAVPGCDPSQISSVTTEEAKATCGDAQVGTGNAIANLPFGPGGTRQDFEAVVTAFNRSDTNGILLHSRVDQLGTTTLLTAVLTGGSKLTVTVPPIGGGVGSSSLFSTSVGAKKYVQARCKDKKIDYKATFSFSDAPDATANDVQPCKQKKRKRK